MKKTLILCLIISTIICSICGCKTGKKASISMLYLTDLEKTLQQTDNDISFKTKQTEDGYTFSYNSSGFIKESFQGITDEEYRVSSITYVADNISSIEALSDKDKLASLIEALQGGYITGGQLSALECFSVALDFYHCCAGYSVFQNVNDFIPLFISHKMEINGWTIEISINKSNQTCTITATFNQ